ncbi:MAG TPA: thioredoxin family protein [Longimicrobiaceae bacterium]|nr:thioredoxin family protein [Longimicrobiaceae bacterium]
MAATPSTMLELGTTAPDFDLPEVMGGRVRLSDLSDAPALLVMFICNHCPFVKHLRAHLARMTREYRERGVAVVAISSNDAQKYPADGPAAMAQEKEEQAYAFPYLFDETQEVAKAYHAACTPDFFLFDGERRLFYRGQYDDSRPGNGVPVTGDDLRSALDAVLAGSEPPAEQKASIGCNIKWRPGNEPEYFG